MQGTDIQGSKKKYRQNLRKCFMHIHVKKKKKKKKKKERKRERKKERKKERRETVKSSCQHALKRCVIFVPLYFFSQSYISELLLPRNQQLVQVRLSTGHIIVNDHMHRKLKLEPSLIIIIIVIMKYLISANL